MSRRDDQRLGDILAAVVAISDHLGRGVLDDGLVFDAVRVRLIEIGEAVRMISPEVLELELDIPWVDVAGCATIWPTATSTPPTPSCGRPSSRICHHSSSQSNACSNAPTDRPPTVCRKDL